VESGGLSGTVTWEFYAGTSGCRSYSRKREEYMADFCLISRRALTDPEYRLFRYHFLLGADWQLCTRQLKMDRGTLFHAIYKLERTLGRAFADTKPFGIYPLDEYFGGLALEEPVQALKPPPRRSKPLRVPVRRAA